MSTTDHLETKGKIIVFEGLDCSFKETASNYLYENLLKLGNKVVKFEFPNYSSESAFFVNQLLQGKYSNSDIGYTAKTTMFILDIFHTFETEIKKYYEEGYIIILDRYYISNMFYQTANLFNIDTGHIDNITGLSALIDGIQSIVMNFKLVKPDLVIFMDQDIEDIKYLLSLKKNKDINELNLDYLKKVYHSYNFFVNNLTSYLNCKTGIIKCKNHENEFKSRNDIAYDAMEIVAKNIEDSSLITNINI